MDVVGLEVDLRKDPMVAFAIGGNVIPVDVEWQ
jgi:hypothetical protein